jgi:outer membrane protein OmpA-like peptidoglycan-associated protein
LSQILKARSQDMGMAKLIGCGLLLGVVAAPAMAQSQSPLSNGGYIAPMGAYLRSDQIDGGYGASILLGHRNGRTALELGAIGARYDETELIGGVIDGLYFPFNSLPNTYGIAGVGWVQYADYPTTTHSVDALIAQAGVGQLWQFSIGRYEFGLRTEALYRLGHRDKYQTESREDINAPLEFNDWVANVGLQLPLSLLPPPEPAPAPAPVLVTEPVAPSDSDQDGVPDTLDQCPGTPPGAKVDENGCEAPKCAEPKPGERISLDGCATGDVIVLKGVNFETDKARLTTNAETILDDVAAALQAHPDIQIEISGHTDSRGSDDHNQALSEARAASVKTYLVSKEIAAARITTVGNGESRPVADNDSEEGWERNRRVELKVREPAAGGAVIPAPTEAVPDETGAAAESAPASESDIIEANLLPAGEPAPTESASAGL